MNRRAASFAVIAVIVVLLAGCGSPDLADDAATRLQADVRTVAQSSQTGDVPGARAALDLLTQHVRSARTDGSISAERSGKINASIDLVSADLTVYEQKEKSLAADKQAADKRTAANRAAAARAAARRAAAAKTAAPPTAQPTAEPTAQPTPPPTAQPTARPTPQVTPATTHG